MIGTFNVWNRIIIIVYHNLLKRRPIKSMILSINAGVYLSSSVNPKAITLRVSQFIHLHDELFRFIIYAGHYGCCNDTDN